MKRYVPSGHRRVYARSKNKLKSREFVMSCWRHFTKTPLLQYWTMCGPMTDHGKLHPNSELMHLISVGFLSPSQFVGVEKIESTHTANQNGVRRMFAKADRPTLIHSDIVDALLASQVAGRLKASIVNLDTIHEPHVGVSLLRKTMNVLNHTDGPSMIAWNVITDRQYPRNVASPWDSSDKGTRGKKHLGFVYESLLNDPVFREVYRHGWDMFPVGANKFLSCRYRDGVATQMTTYVFCRTKKACRNSCGC